MFLTSALFLVCFILPGYLILYLIEPKWIKFLRFDSEVNAWHGIPTSFGISIGLISIISWIGYYLHFNFQFVKTTYLWVVAIIFFIFLLRLGLQFVGKKDKEQTEKASEIEGIGRYEVFLLLFLVAITVVAAYGGIWLSHTADSLNHMTVVNAIQKFDTPLPQQIYWPDPIQEMDPTFGTWHVALAILTNVSNADIEDVFYISTVILVPLYFLAFILLGNKLLKSKYLALTSGMLFFVISPDLRTIAYPNKMGQILLWISLLFFVISFSKPSIRKHTITMVALTGLFSWTLGAIHQQYPLVLIGIISAIIFLLTVASVFILKLKISSLIKKYQTGITVFLVVLMFSGAVAYIRATYTITDYYPLVAATPVDAADTTTKAQTVIDGLLAYYSFSKSFNVLATLTTLYLLATMFLSNKVREINICLTAIIVFALISPVSYLVFGLTVGKSGLISTLIGRLILLTSPLLVFVVVYAAKQLYKQNQGYNWSFLCISVFIVFFTFAVMQHVLNPKGGLVSLYTSSNYPYRISVSRDSNLLLTRSLPIVFFKSVPDNTLILADQGVSYEMAAITGKKFVQLPSAHVPLHEKAINAKYAQLNKTFAGIDSFFSFVQLLLEQDIAYIYVDRDRYNGPTHWVQLPKIPVLELVNGDENWRIYRVDSQLIPQYLDIQKRIENASYGEKILALRELKELYSSKENYESYLQTLFPLSVEEAERLIASGDKYQSVDAEHAAFRFLDHLNDANTYTNHPELIKRSAIIINREAHGTMLVHPPARISIPVKVPENACLKFSIALDPAVWEEGKGDGVLFKLDYTESGVPQELFRKYIDPKISKRDRRWLDYMFDLTNLSGKHTYFIFSTTGGLYGNENYDWAVWGDPYITTAEDDPTCSIEILQNRFDNGSSTQDYR